MFAMRIVLALSAIVALSPVSPAGARDLYAGIFGMQSHPEVRQLVNDAGFGWVRYRLLWYLAQQSPPAGCNPHVDFNTENFETMVNTAVADGYKVLATIRGTPGWANGGQDERHPPASAASFQAYAKLVAAHFCGRVTAWDLWNEPNLNNYWTGTAAQYRELVLKPGIAGVHAGCPGAWVVAPSIASGDTGTVDSFTRDGGAGGTLIDGIDSYSIHLPYSDVNTQLGVMDAMNDWCAPKQKCLGYMVTEFGDNGSDAGSEMNQILNKCDNQTWCDLAMVFWLHAADWPAGSQWKGYSLLNDSGLPKNRFCKVEQHNTGAQVAPCPCSASTPGCAGVP